MPDRDLSHAAVKLGSVIRTLREARGLLLNDIARETGIDCTVLSRIERGKQDVTFSRLEAIAKALRVPVGNLLPRRASRSSSHS